MRAMTRHPVDPGKRKLAKAMRAQMTRSEFRLWMRLRGGLAGYRFRRQVPIGPYIADFLCFERRLMVEVDGDQHGHHAGIVADRRRDDWLSRQGFRVARFTNREINDNVDGVCETILAKLARPDDPS